MNIPLLDIIIPGQTRRPRIPRRVIDTVEQVKKEVTDTAVQVRGTVQDTAAQLQDYVAGGNVGSDDNSTLLWSLLVVFAALILCLWFAYTYRQRLKLSQK